MANELNRIDYFIAAELNADSQLNSVVSNRVYVQSVPQPATQAARNAMFPYILATFQSSIDVAPIAVPHRTMTKALYQVAVVCNGAPDGNAYLAADRIDAVVGFARSVTLVCPNGETWVFNSYRQTPLALTQFDEAAGVKYERRGGLYRIEAYPITGT